MGDTDLQRFPKVLILCDRFDNSTGMGVTLTNLFMEWPKMNLALAGFNIDKSLCEEIRPCASYFALNGRFITSTQKKIGSSRRPSLLRSVLKFVYNKLGMSDNKDIPISKDLEQFIVEFDPDIIFSALGDLSRIRFTERIANLYPASKLALYIVDDWPDSRFDGRWFESCWRKKYFNATQNIVNRADICMSICQKMSETYHQRYGKYFYPFHNPVAINAWEEVSPLQLYEKNIFSIAYVGKINRDTERQLITLAKCVEALNTADRKIKFDIYTPSIIPLSLKNFSNTEIKSAVPNSEVPSLLKSYSLLFLTLGFSNETIKYVKLSMPTKLTEYLASGTPILLYAPEDIALSEYLSKHDAAVICSKESDLQEVLEGIISDDSLLKKFVFNALKEVQKHDAPVVRSKFRKVLNLET